MAAAGLFGCFSLLLGLGWDRANRRLHESKLALAQRGLELAAIQSSLSQATAELLNLRGELEAAKKRPKSIECDEMLQDMVTGGALLHVRRIDANDVFMMSPRTAR